MAYPQPVRTNGDSKESPKTMAGNVSALFAVKNSCGALCDILAVFKKHNVSLTHIESRPSKQEMDKYEFLVTCKQANGELKSALDDLRQMSESLTILEKGGGESHNSVEWFPRKFKDLDITANNVLGYGSELDADHPGFKDPEYRARRKKITDASLGYKACAPIPRVEYTESEINTWGQIFRELTKLYPTHACKEFNYVFPMLIENCNYNEHTIPQLQDVSQFLKECTGFTLRPVAGLLSSRDYLASLAFRVFQSTQYIRHHSVPMYTPEPDVCHELLGHVPLFADPSFADFSQEIGLASLGASDEDIVKLSTLYWFTVEFGLCRQSDTKELRAYGAGLLSSFGELQYCLTEKPETRPFIPSETSETPYPITKFQPTYFVAESFEDAKQKMREYAATIKRPFSVRYNPYTQSVEVMDKQDHVRQIVKDVQGQLAHVATLLKAVSH